MKRAATTSGSAKLRPVEEAAARVRSRDTLAVPLGPGQPAAFLHALGERESFDELTVFGALLIEPFRVFTLPGVRLLSGFFGPVERGLLEAGFDVEFVPADFRRFAPIAERLRPRVMATAASPPDADGRMSLALHAGATTEALLECGRDPARVLVVEINRALPRTRGLLPDRLRIIFCFWDSKNSSISLVSLVMIVCGRSTFGKCWKYILLMASESFSGLLTTITPSRSAI
jgi:hypothetical protein